MPRAAANTLTACLPTRARHLCGARRRPWALSTSTRSAATARRRSTHSCQRSAAAPGPSACRPAPVCSSPTSRSATRRASQSRPSGSAGCWAARAWWSPRCRRSRSTRRRGRRRRRRPTASPCAARSACVGWAGRSSRCARTGILVPASPRGLPLPPDLASSAGSSARAPLSVAGAGATARRREGRAVGSLEALGRLRRRRRRQRRGGRGGGRGGGGEQQLGVLRQVRQVAPAPLGRGVCAAADAAAALVG